MPHGGKGDQMTKYQERLNRALFALDGAEYILLGGGAGLSDAAGLRYSGTRFTDNFAPFIARYGFTDLYTSSFHPFETQEERWAYWAKHIALNRYDEPAAPLYQQLFRLVENRTYFVITTNVDHQFNKSGFAEDRVFAVQGDYGLFQCARACHDRLYDNEAQVAAMIKETRDLRIPADLVPKCPVCGGDMEVNLRKDEFFVEDGHWHESQARYLEFLKASEGKKVACLELGVGFNTPGIIRFPFEQLAYRNDRATLIRMNRDDPGGAKENTGRTVAFDEPISQVVEALLSRNRNQARLVSIHSTANGGEKHEQAE